MQQGHDHITTVDAGKQHRRLTKATVNGRNYALGPVPVVVICADGCSPEYIDAVIVDGRAPALARMRATLLNSGYDGLARAAMPTFTNPNNLSIVTGASPSVHGISGNYTLDRATRSEVMMLDDSGMISETIPGALSKAGARVVVITAKDKLRKALSRGLDGVSGSAERAEELQRVVGPAFPAAVPDKYSADLSLFVLDAGVSLLRQRRADLMYLSLSDFVQHAHAPDAPEALEFMAALDQRIAEFVDLGAVVGIVADHGMTDMARPDGTPNVVWLGDILDAQFGADTTRVICPINDPFGRHHASLGGFVRNYLFDPTIDAEAARDLLARAAGVNLVLTGAEAAERFDMPAEAEGDLAVIGAPGFALGACRADHDLSQLAGTRLRSHGGLAEQQVPFLLSHPLTPEMAARLSSGARVWDIFDAAINGVIP